MATAALGLSASRMSVGRVFERAFATVRQNPLVTILFAFFFAALPNLGLAVVIAAMDTGDTDPPISTSAIQMLVMFTLTALVVSLAQAAQTPAVLAFREGRRGTISQGLSMLVRAIVPVVILGLLSGASIFLGCVLLIVPGLFLWVVWSVSVPTLVAERLGILASLRRSAQLTKKARWQVLAVLLLVASANIGVSIGVEVFTGEFQNDDSWAGLFDPTYLAATLIADIILSSVAGAINASLYVELRDWKEGPGIDNLEDVFA